MNKIHQVHDPNARPCPHCGAPCFVSLYNTANEPIGWRCERHGSVIRLDNPTAPRSI